jgi:hypothetical protein
MNGWSRKNGSWTNENVSSFFFFSCLFLFVFFSFFLLLFSFFFFRNGAWTNGRSRTNGSWTNEKVSSFFFFFLLSGNVINAPFFLFLGKTNEGRFVSFQENVINMFPFFFFSELTFSSLLSLSSKDGQRSWGPTVSPVLHIKRPDRVGPRSLSVLWSGDRI